MNIPVLIDKDEDTSALYGHRQEQWTIGTERERERERGGGNSVLLARIDDKVYNKIMIFYFKRWSCPWCNGYRRRKWIRRYEFKSWTRLITFYIALIPLGKA